VKRKFKKIIVKIFRMNNTPHEIALGTAIGVFIGILPFYGFHTLMVLIVIALIRPVNKIAVLAGTNISLPPTLPFITWTAYDIGRYILQRGYPPLCWADFKNLNFESIRYRFYPLLIGSLILGGILAVIFYFLTYFVVKRVVEKRAHAKRKRSQG
jgi:uncharacterized protein (TIGR03546 family)